MKQEQLQALGRRAVACSGWRWMPGMQVLEGLCSRARVLGVKRKDFDISWQISDGAWDLGFLEKKDGEVPDLSDPATLGCLLALVREAWGEPDLVVERYAGRRWGIDDGGDWVIADTEAEALVAALEAAP